MPAAVHIVRVNTARARAYMDGALDMLRVLENRALLPARAVEKIQAGIVRRIEVVPVARPRQVQ